MFEKIKKKLWIYLLIGLCLSIIALVVGLKKRHYDTPFVIGGAIIVFFLPIFFAYFIEDLPKLNKKRIFIGSLVAFLILQGIYFGLSLWWGGGVSKYLAEIRPDLGMILGNIEVFLTLTIIVYILSLIVNKETRSDGIYSLVYGTISTGIIASILLFYFGGRLYYFHSSWFVGTSYESIFMLGGPILLPSGGYILWSIMWYFIIGAVIAVQIKKSIKNDDRGESKLAIFSMMFGIISIAILIAPLAFLLAYSGIPLPFYSIPFSTVAIFIGIMAIKSILKKNLRGKFQAITGIILGAITIIYAIYWIYIRQ